METHEFVLQHKRAFDLLYPDLVATEEPVKIARYCAMCSTLLPVAHICLWDRDVWCPACQEQIDALGSDKVTPKTLSAYAEPEWYTFYRFCTLCGKALASCLREGRSVGSMVFCRACYQEIPSWVRSVERDNRLRSEMIFQHFWEDCWNGNVHAMPMWAQIYKFRLRKRVALQKDGKQYIVVGIILLSGKILGLFYPFQEHASAPLEIRWRSSLDREEGKQEEK